MSPPRPQHPRRRSSYRSTRGGDLSTDLGYPLETRHPEVLAAINTVIATCDRHGVPSGTLCSSIDDAADMLTRGMHSIVFPNERTILLNVYRETFSALHDLANQQK